MEQVLIVISTLVDLTKSNLEALPREFVPGYLNLGAGGCQISLPVLVIQAEFILHVVSCVLIIGSFVPEVVKFTGGTGEMQIARYQI